MTVRMAKEGLGYIAAVVILTVGIAFAQAPQPTEPPADPRLAGQTIKALNAILALREAEVAAIKQDAQKAIAERDKAWAEYAKPLYEPQAEALATETKASPTEPPKP